MGMQDGKKKHTLLDMLILFLVVWLVVAFAVILFSACISHTIDNIQEQDRLLLEKGNRKP